MNPTNLRIMSVNLEHSGLPIGGQPDRRYAARAHMATYRPHIVLRQEVRGPDGTYEAAMAELVDEARALGLAVALLAPGTPESPNATAVMVDPELFEVQDRFVHVTGMWHPIANPVVRLRGASRPLSLASFHLCSWSASWRELEAERLLILADKGRSAIIGGDTNSYPHAAVERHTLPDWREVDDAGHARRRTVTDRSGRWVAHTRPDEILAGTTPAGTAPYIELGAYAATNGLGQPAAEVHQHEALTPTASLWPRDPDQGPRQRIDRLYCTPDLAPALMRVWVDDSPAWAKYSDHAIVGADFELETLRNLLQ